MSREQAYQQRKQNTVLPRALTKSAPEPASEPELPEPDHESKSHPPARKEPEKLSQGGNGSNAKKEPPSQSPTSGPEATEETDPEPEPPVEKEAEHPHQAEQQKKESAPLPPDPSKGNGKSDHPPSKGAEAPPHSQPPPPVEEDQQQKKQAAQRPPQ